MDRTTKKLLGKIPNASKPHPRTILCNGKPDIDNTYGKKLLKLYDDAIAQGDTKLAHEIIKTILAYLWGKPKESLDVTTNDKDLQTINYNFDSIPTEQLRLIRDTIKKAIVPDEEN